MLYFLNTLQVFISHSNIVVLLKTKPSINHFMFSGLPIGQHIHLSVKLEDDLVIRAYTPVSSDEEKGYVDLVVKVCLKDYCMSL